MPVAMELSMIVEITSLTPRHTFSDRGDRCPRRADGDRHEDDVGHLDDRGERHGRTGRGGEHRRHAVLAVDADVEQVHLEADRDGERRHVVGDRPVDHRYHRVGRVGVLPHRLERVDRAVAARPRARCAETSEREHDRSDGRREREEDAARPAHAAVPSFAPVMYEPSSTGVTVAGSSVATMLAAKDHEQRVGQPDQLFEVGGDRAAPRAPRCGPDGCSPTPRPARRRRCRGSGWEAIEQLRVAEHLAPDDELLLVAARQRVRSDVDARRADVEVVDDLLACAHALPAGRSTRPSAYGGRRLVAEHAVLPQRRGEQQAVVLAVFGDVADAVLAAEASGGVADVDSTEA